MSYMSFSSVPIMQFLSVEERMASSEDVEIAVRQLHLDDRSGVSEKLQALAKVSNVQ